MEMEIRLYLYKDGVEMEVDDPGELFVVDCDRAFVDVRLGNFVKRVSVMQICQPENYRRTGEF